MKEFLVAAYMFRFCKYGIDNKLLEDNAYKHYDLVGEKQFILATGLTKERIKNETAEFPSYFSQI